MEKLPEQYAWRKSSLPGQDHVIEGEPVISFRGDTYTYIGVSRKAYGNSTGRVLVTRPCSHDDHTSPGLSWCKGEDRREFFPSVFDLYLGDAEGNEV